MDFLDPIFLIKTLGLIGIFAIIFIESGFFFGFFFPGDSLLFTAGLLSAGGYFNFPVLVIGTVLAATLGCLFGYLFGNHIGPALFTREDSLLFNKKHLIRAQEYYEKHGKATLIIARFIPIIRTFAPIVAGIGKMNLRIFLVYNLISALMWAAGLTALGFYLGKSVPDIERYILPIVLSIILISFIPAIWKLRRGKQNS